MALSGGEQARIPLARTLAQRTPLLLLDEPTAALDLRHAENTLGHLRYLAGAGSVVAVVLHDLNLAAAHADRVIVIDRGRVGADAPPPQVLTERVLSQCYGHPVDVVAHPRTGTRSSSLDPTELAAVPHAKPLVNELRPSPTAALKPPADVLMPTRR
jgi:iron complex transport system ATP-binding protein